MYSKECKKYRYPILRIQITILNDFLDWNKLLCDWHLIRHWFILKMEYVSKINIFGMKMMVNSGLKKYFVIPPCAKLFFLLHKNAQNCKFSNTNDFLCTRAWRDFNKTFCDTSTDHKWMFKLQISSIFNFDLAHQSWIRRVLGVIARQKWLMHQIKSAQYIYQ